MPFVVRTTCGIIRNTAGQFVTECRTLPVWVPDLGDPFPPRLPPGGGGGVTPPGALPQPIPPQPPVGTPPTFPQPGTTRLPPARPPFGVGPAANDPIFRRGAAAILRRILGPISKILGPVGAATGITGVLDQISERLLDLAFEEWIASEISRARRGRIAQETPPREVIVPGDTVPQPTLPDFERIPRPEFPGFPGGVRVPEVPNFPEISIPFPTPTLPQPGPVQVPTPQLPTPQPTGLPQSPTLPRIFPGFFGSPVGAPLQTPFRAPVSDPVPLTPVQPGMPLLPGSLGLPFTGTRFTPQPQAQPQPQQERCQVVKRRRRKKGRCREGFFRETATGTKYVTWRSRKCGATARKVIKFPALGI